MATKLPRLTSKEQVDEAINNTIDKVCVLRFGRERDVATMQLDDIVRYLLLLCLWCSFVVVLVGA
jgi:hypothetical protein